MEASNYQKIVSVAQGLVQQKGYNAFSYRDLSEAIGIKTSSIHYYFPTKDDLGETLVKEYRRSFKEALDQISAKTSDPLEQLDLYIDLFLGTMKSDGKICLCGMLASDHNSLAKKVQSQVKEFFEENKIWLAEVLENGKKNRSFAFDGKALDIAQAFFASLEGAMLVARVYGDHLLLENIAKSWKKAFLRKN